MSSPTAQDAPALAGRPPTPPDVAGSRAWKHASALERITLGVAAGLGVVVAAEGHGSPELRHRLAAYAVGALLLLPAALLVALGARALSVLRRIAVSGAALVAALLVLEVAARVLGLRALAPPAFELHAALGRVHVPLRGSIDAWGFRNASVPSRADVVVLGDSQTYGENIRAHEAYPQRLAGRTGLAVYNMSLGGYGPLQMQHLLPQALSLSPRAVVLGFYAGNDLVDAHRFAALPHWSELRDPALRYDPPSELAPAPDASANLALALVDGAVERSWVLTRLTYDLKLWLKSQRAFAGTYGRAGAEGILSEGPIRTRFSAAYRLAAVDATLPVVRDGLRITGVAIQRIAQECAAAGVPAVLLLIPTKERVYHELFAERDPARARALAALAAAERDVTGRVAGMGAAAGLVVVDPMPQLLAALAADRPLWPHGDDGHFNADGAAVLAEVLASALAELGLAGAR